MRAEFAPALVLAASLAAAAAVGACQSGSPSPTPGSSRTVLYSEDFSAGPGSFETYADDTTTAQARDGSFQITFTEADLITQAPAGQDFGDAVVEVDATDTGPQAARRFGIFCRMPDQGLFYEFAIDSAGEAGIRVAAYLTTGAQPLTLTATPAVSTGLGATNHLRADCIGPTFTFWVNGHQVAALSDDTTARGDVGIFASSASDGNTVVAFDNFAVSAP